MSSVEFINQTIPVEARLLTNGEWQPLAFQWRGRRESITEIGRQWQEDVEGVAWRCFMIRTGDGTAFELRLDASAGRWLLARAWPPSHMA